MSDEHRYNASGDVVNKRNECTAFDRLNANGKNEANGSLKSQYK